MPQKIPGSEKLHLKDAFVKRYRELLGKDYEQFLEYSLSFLRRSIRVNTLKMSVEELKKRLENEWTLKQVPWCSEGFWIEGERFDIGNLPEHMLGYFHVQEAASMLPPIALAPKPGETVLDMCASPGSKTTQIAAMMKNEGVLIANDISGERMKPLGINVQKAGATNVVLTMSKGHRLLDSGTKFDRILVDAPCSGTGTIRKSLKTLQIWNPYMIKRLAGTQKILLDTAFRCLKDEGTVVYSTCSLEPEENEAVVHSLLKKYDNANLEEFRLDIKRSPCFLEYGGEKFSPDIKKCLRIWPQDNDTEGFFVAKIKKS
ncbi:RsmB/NOP family class I SAM-dependent RNA methyltransferase [Candidatus Woesearchaeota archaeon]|nr:RsmB/NOP family class I SAM-dependent RNA methyltransferase [Candidatus Woesearchaeota archaeon]